MQGELKGRGGGDIEGGRGSRWMRGRKRDRGWKGRLGKENGTREWVLSEAEKKEISKALL